MINIDGTLSIIDYKTGSAHNIKQINSGYAPQLPIEGIIAEHGGFEGIKKAKVSNLSYWRLNKEIINVQKDLDEILESNFNKIKELINTYDNEEIGYVTKPNPKYCLAKSDYQHLSRIDEWEVNENDD